MKIVMALDYYLPHVSGLSLFVERLSAGLAGRGHAVTVLTHRHASDSPAQECRGAVRVVRAPVLVTVGKALLSPALVAAAHRELEGADVFHLHAPLAPAVPLTAVALNRGTPIVVTYHCDLKAPAGIAQRLVETVARAAQNFALDHAARIVTYTEDYARHTPSLAERLDNVRWILPPVPEPPAPQRTAEEVRARYGIHGRPVLLFLGRFAEEKGLTHLLAALPLVRRRFPEATLVLAGEREKVPGETVGQRLTPLLEDPGSGIVATGLISPDRVSELFSIADVLVLASTNSTESFGMVQVEGMLCGVPSVASDLPGVRQPVRLTGMGEIARVADPQDLARALRAVLEQPLRYRRSREEILRIFSFDRTIGQYEAVYRCLAGVLASPEPASVE